MKYFILLLLVSCQEPQQQERAGSPEGAWEDHRQGVYYTDLERCYLMDDGKSICEKWYKGEIVSTVEYDAIP